MAALAAAIFLSAEIGEHRLDDASAHDVALLKMPDLAHKKMAAETAAIS